jgi:hypothetical protein
VRNPGQSPYEVKDVKRSPNKLREKKENPKMKELLKKTF